jgi:hypothetical protein
MSVRVNANLRSETVDQLLEKKKGMHMTSAQLMADEVKAELEVLAESISSLERKSRDASLMNDPAALSTFSNWINAQCEAIVQLHKSIDSARYADDNTFRGLVAEILNMKSWAKETWQLWLRDESQKIFFLKSFSLLECHRLWLGHLRKRICASAPGSEERRVACLELLQSKGLLKAAARGERNAAGEDLIVAAGAEGWIADDVNALLGAGADVTTADIRGKTGVWNAASCGHVYTLKALLDAKGNPNDCTNSTNQTSTSAMCSAVYIAAQNGHVDCMEELIAHKADVLRCNKYAFEFDHD